MGSLWKRAGSLRSRSPGCEPRRVFSGFGEDFQLQFHLLSGPCQQERLESGALLGTGRREWNVSPRSLVEEGEDGLWLDWASLQTCKSAMATCTLV